MKALMTLMAEWQSADSYATRFSKINTGISGFKFNYSSTVKTDSAADVLTAAGGGGSPAVDWFFGTFSAGADTMVNFETGEHVNNT
jgi:hypothetical protein